MMPLDFDMELLRLVGQLRAALAASADSAVAVAACDAALQRAKKASPAIAPRLEAVASALSSGGDLRAECASVLEAIEGLIVEGDGSTWAVAVEERAAKLAAPATPPAPASTAGNEPQDTSLHGVANRLILMEPTIIDSLLSLRDHFARAFGAWQGDAGVRAQLAEALEALDAVAADGSSPEADRVQVVERVGHALEVALLAEEEAQHGPAADVAPVAPVPVAAPVRAAAQPVAAAPVVAAPEAPAVGGRLAMPADADPALTIEFVAEGLDYLDQAEKALLALEADPADAEAVNVTFRAFHTIKGVSAFLGLEQITSVAHHAETLLAQVRSGTLAFNAAAADLFLRSSDVLRALLVGIREVAKGGDADVPPALAGLMAELTDPGITARLAANTKSVDVAAAPAEATRPAAAAAPQVAIDTSVATAQAEDSVRIRTERLDKLVDLVGELVVAQSMIMQDPEVTGSKGDLSRKVDHSQKILRDLQALSTSLRMVPLKPAFQKISRVVRDVSQKSGKKVELVTMGDDTELDRSMVGVITDPLVHMVRNAVDHGIEHAADRAASGKPEHGTLRLSARQTGGNVVVEIEDDGKGLDRAKILAKAVEKGIVDADRVLADSEVYNLVFAPGFSTAEKVTDISGRGVGMDVVKRAVESLRGRVEIWTELGKGTRFSIYLPLTLAITDGMLVEVGSQRYIIPTQKIQLSFRPTDKDLWSVSQRGEMVMLHGSLIPVARLHKLFEVAGAEEDLTRGLLVVVGEGSRRTALLVDELLGQQQFVVKALTDQVTRAPGLAGGAILGDGAVGLILDPDELVEVARGTRKGKKAGTAA